DVQGEAEDVGGLQPGCRHVVAVADPGDDLAVDGAALLDAGEDVGQDLARVVFVGQAVDHRHARVGGERLELGLLEGADHDDVDHPADHARRVLDRLGAAELAVGGGQIHDRAAHLVHAGLEADARPRRRLLEDHRQRAVDQRRVFLVVLEALLDDRRALEQVRVFLGSEILELQEVLAEAHAGFHAGSRRNSLIRGQRIATICAASSRFRINEGSRRTTRSAVTLIMSPASAERPSRAAHGRSSSMPIIRPWPRTSTTPGTPASSRSSPVLSIAPTSAALASRPSSSMIRSVSTPARIASGLPPKVVPWLPGPNTPAARGPQTTAPIGTPEPRPLATGMTSGRMPAHWCANHLPVRPIPHCTSSSISSQPRSSQIRRASLRYGTVVGRIPPSPWITSRKMATTFGLVRATFSIAATSLSGTRTKPSTRGPKPAWILALPVADRVAIERPWKAAS